MAGFNGFLNALGLPPQASPRLVRGGAVIAAIVLCSAAAFAFTGGWLTPDRLSPEQLVYALKPPGVDPAGHRRNHAKGVCFTGSFLANGAGAAFSSAPMLAAGRYPVIGRFAIGVADPNAADGTGRVRSMAVRVTAPDGQEWRSGMNAMPRFPVATPANFLALLQTSAPDPKTGKPDPGAVPRFVAAHPEMVPFVQWATTAPWTGSYADQTYNSINAFVFIAPDGSRHVVRWSMQAILPETPTAPADLAKLGPDFLSQDLMARLGQGQLTWHLVATLAAPGDPTGDATKTWPNDRQTVTLGDLVVERAEGEPDGPCRDFNYDPLILPAGIEPSDDPLLPARSSAYAVSFDRRTAEASAYSRTQAGKAAP